MKNGYWYHCRISRYLMHRRLLDQFYRTAGLLLCHTKDHLADNRVTLWILLKCVIQQPGGCSCRDSSLFGWNWLQHIRLNWPSINNIQVKSSV